ncbi:MAG: DUF167 domain-containing protein [Steroidobacteraceae bacterium]
MPRWWRQGPTGLRLLVRIQPRAGADRVHGVQAGRLRIRIAAAPVEDAANARLRRFMADLCGVPQSAVRVLQGNKSRDKLLAVDGVQQLPAALAVFAAGSS